MALISQIAEDSKDMVHSKRAISTGIQLQKKFTNVSEQKALKCYDFTVYIRGT